VEGIDQACLLDPPHRPRTLRLQVEAKRSGRPQTPDQTIGETRLRYGYRRVHVLLVRDGWAINAKRVYRFYRS
jgi:hypothetical protein